MSTNQFVIILSGFFSNIFLRPDGQDVRWSRNSDPATIISVAYIFLFSEKCTFWPDIGDITGIIHQKVRRIM
jgi:hypothetical protein